MKSYAGDAIVTTLTADITSADSTINIADATGWSSGAGGKPFVIELHDDSGHEKVLVASRTGTTLTVSARGFDETVARGFLASGPTRVMQVFDADSATKFADHIGPSEDPDNPHADTLLNDERHDDPAKHVFGAGHAFGEPQVPNPISSSAPNAGAGDNPANEGHTHALDASVAGDGLTLTTRVLHVVVDGTTLVISGDSIKVKDGGIGATQILDASITAAELATGAVINVKMADDSVDQRVIAPLAVGTPELAANAVTLPKLPGSTMLPYVNATAPGSPVLGQCWIHPTSGDVKFWYGATTGWRPAWNLPWGWIGDDDVVGNVAAGSGLTDVGLSVTWTAVANRKYKAIVEVPLIQQLTANGQGQISLTDASNNIAPRSKSQVMTTNGVWSGDFTTILKGLAAGSTTRKVMALTNAGTLSLRFADAGAAGRLTIEDVGPEGAYT